MIELATTGYSLIGYSLVLIIWGVAFEAAGFLVLWLVIRGISADQHREDEEVRARDVAEAAAAEAQPSERKAA
jgi:Na+-transporting methylmalonyl-CoA/oxaloacetate decarboxylase gamma subunit